MTYVIINYHDCEETTYGCVAPASACCICITEKRARDKAASLARDHIAEMVKDGILENCMEVNIVEQGHGFEIYHDKSYCNGEFICGFTVSEVDCFDPPELEIQIKVNSGQFGDAIQPGDAAFYKKEGGSNV
jgi:hypothetical protein